LKATPVWPLAVAGLAIAGAMLNVTPLEPLGSTPLLAVTVAAYGLPEASVGVPVIAPLPVFTVRPGGRPLAPNVVGELVAVIV
jgi:hypothetical protein